MTTIRYILLLIVLFISIQNSHAQKEAATQNELFLLEAVNKGNIERVKMGLATNTSPNITDDYGISLLMIAVKQKNISMIDILIKAGADPNYRINQKGPKKEGQNVMKMLQLKYFSPLDFAIDTQDTTIVNAILKAGAEINPKEKYLSPLGQASYNNDYPMLIYLARKGAKVSKEVGRYILTRCITLRLSSKKTASDNLNEIIEFWDNQGIEISVENLLKSNFTNRSSRYKIPDIISEYHIWLDKKSKNEKIIRSAAYANYIDPDYDLKKREKIRKDSLAKASRIKREQEWRIRDAEFEKELEKENTARMIFFYTISGIAGILLFVFIKYGSLNRAVWESIFQKLFRVQPNPKPQPNSNSNSKPNNTNKNKPINPPKPPTKPQPKPKPKQQPQKTAAKPAVKPKPTIPSKQQSISDKKGWVTDMTKDIPVELLTIEDMINPIRLCNEHEKAIRRMMWYMRRLENHTDEQIALVLGEEGLLPHLEALWQSITKTYVRDVYKRSLILMVENYKIRDERVQSFISTIKKRGNKPKKKSEKQAERKSTNE